MLTVWRRKCGDMREKGFMHGKFVFVLFRCEWVACNELKLLGTTKYEILVGPRKNELLFR